MRILIAIDESEESHDAVRLANDVFELASAHGAARHEVLVLHVARSITPFAYIADPITGGIFYPETIPVVMAAQEKIDAEEADAVTTTVAEVAGETTTLNAHGDAGNMICEAVHGHEIDIVVIGTRERGTWSKLWHRSVSDYVVRHAACAVLVAR